MDHDELVRKYSTGSVSEEASERFEELREHGARLRAAGQVVPESMAERHDFPIGLDKNSEPFARTEPDQKEHTDNGNQQ